MSTVYATNLVRRRRKNGLKSTLLHRFFLSIHLFRLSDGVIEQMLTRHGSGWARKTRPTTDIARSGIHSHRSRHGHTATISMDLLYCPYTNLLPLRLQIILPSVIWQKGCFLFLLSEFPQVKIKLFRWVEKLIYRVLSVKI